MDDYSVLKRLHGGKICPFMTRITKKEQDNYKVRAFCHKSFCSLWVQTGENEDEGCCCFKAIALGVRND